MLKQRFKTTTAIIVGLSLAAPYPAMASAAASAPIVLAQGAQEEEVPPQEEAAPEEAAPEAPAAEEPAPAPEPAPEAVAPPEPAPEPAPEQPAAEEPSLQEATPEAATPEEVQESVEEAPVNTDTPAEAVEEAEEAPAEAPAADTGTGEAADTASEAETGTQTDAETQPAASGATEQPPVTQEAAPQEAPAQEASEPDTAEEMEPEQPDAPAPDAAASGEADSDATVEEETPAAGETTTSGETQTETETGTQPDAGTTAEEPAPDAAGDAQTTTEQPATGDQNQPAAAAATPAPEPEMQALEGEEPVDVQQTTITRTEASTATQERSEDRRRRDRDRDDDDDDDRLRDLLGAAAIGLTVGALLPRSNNTRVVDDYGDRVILERNGRYYVRRDENELLYRPGVNVRTEEYPNGYTRTIVTRPNGVQVVTVRDEGGYIIRRARITPDGQRFVLYESEPYYDREYVNYDEVLPPLRINMPRNRYIVDYQDADREIIRETFLAPPVDDVTETYSIQDVRDSERLRDYMPRVDLTSITFATGSSAIQPSQLDSLDTVGRTIEEILADNPREIFLIEGHTDAVGSDAANLALSDRRAESVALALTENYEIPPENLVVQGYGEQYLKVETQGPERANRRVTMRRITPLVNSAAAD